VAKNSYDELTSMAKEGDGWSIRKRGAQNLPFRMAGGERKKRRCTLFAVRRRGVRFAPEAASRKDGAFSHHFPLKPALSHNTEGEEVTGVSREFMRNSP